MSDFAVRTHEITEILPHPNAEKLEIAHINNIAYQFVVGKGSFNVGQRVLYFPVDAILPHELAQRLALPVKEDKPYRLKSIRLRGQWSEGVLASLPAIGLDPKLDVAGADYAEALGVKKYEPAEFNGAGFRSFPEDLIALPVTVDVYDIENLQRYPEVFNRLVNQPVYVTEKLEGSHWWARLDKDLQTFHVGQRRYEIKVRESDDKNLHPWWQAFYDQGLDKYLFCLGQYYRGYDVTIRGEIIGAGIQGNYYGLPEGKRQVYLFEIELNGEPIDAESFLALTNPNVYAVLRVPLLSVHWTPSNMGIHNVEEAVSYAHGYSLINPDKLREGVVYKPLVEQYDPEIGRLFIKVRDAEYLAQ